jgi:thioredoxin 1
MTKFGKLIDSRIPTLIDFYSDKSKSENSHRVLRDVAASLGEKAKVVKIDISKNYELATALRVKRDPTFIIYKNGEVKWRQSGIQDAGTLISLMQQYI